MAARPRRIAHAGAAGRRLAVAAALACGPQSGDPHPCSDDAAQAACRRDAPLTGAYPAVDASMAAWLDEDGAPPGCGLGITVGDAVVHVRGYGLADLGPDGARGGGDDRPFTLATLGALGSVSKTITAIALHRLIAARGAAGPSLDDRLADVLPAVPSLLADVPLRRLLSHRAGLASLSYGDAYDDPYLDDDALGRLFPSDEHPSAWPRNTYWGLRGNLVAGDPGTYANVNYHLVGAVLDYYADPGADPAVIRGLSRRATAARDFTDDPDAGYVRLVIDVVAHGAADPDDHLISMCPRTPWGAPGLRALARGHGDDGEDLSEVGFVSGRIASGGWLMTAGDFARLVALLAGDALVERDALTADPAPITSLSLGAGNPAVVAGEGTWVMSHVFPDMSEVPAIHHLGRVDGYTAYYRLTAGGPGDLPAIGVALMCNGRVKNRVMVARAQGLVDAVMDDLAGGAGPSITRDPALAGCDP